jgi:hypothetical protein
MKTSITKGPRLIGYINLDQPKKQPIKPATSICECCGSIKYTSECVCELNNEY